MRKIRTALSAALCLLLLPGLLGVPTLAAQARSETPLVELTNTCDVPYESTTFWQGDKMSYEVHFPSKDGAEAAGLVPAGTAVDTLYDSQGNIITDRFLYPATVSYGFISLDTSNVTPGEYRFVYLSPWTQNQGGVSVIRPGFAYCDVTILPKEAPSAWAAEEVQRAAERYLVPDLLSNRYTSPVTRDHFMLIVNALFRAKTAGEAGGAVGLVDYAARQNLSVSDNPFSDINHRFFADRSHNYVVAANKLGIINGKSEGIFDPNGLLTRQEAATILSRAAKALGADVSGAALSFVDSAAVADWAKDGVAYVTAKGIMNGVDGNRFDPNGVYTYQQAYITALRMLKALSGQTTGGAAPAPDGGVQPMSTPFNAAGHTFTIQSAGPDEALRGTAKTPAAGQTFFYVTFVESNPDTLSYDDLLAVFRQAYLQTADGKAYYASYEDPWGIYVNRTVGFSIPADTDTDALVFVVAGQSRSLR